MPQPHEVFLVGEITKHSIKKVRKAFNHPNDDDTIFVGICSSGGECDVALGIIDMMTQAQKLGVKVATIAYGKAHSAAADILAFGTKGMRACSPNTSVLFHEQSCSLDLEKSNGHLKYLAFESKRQENFLRQLAAQCGQDFEKMKKDVEGDLWLTAQEAKDYGVVDIVM